MFKGLPNLKYLYTFESAARHNSYSQAANELCLSQAAVSQQMRQLETQLNYKLFYRKDKQMLLTEQGKSLYAATFDALSILDAQIKTLAGDQAAGSLTVTTTQAFASLWLVPKLHLFSLKYPDIKVNVKSSAGFESLTEQGIDLAIRFGVNVEKATDKQYQCDFFGEDQVFPVCSVATARQINPKQPLDLLKTWLVHLEHSGPYDWRLWFDHENIDEDIKHDKWTQVNSTDIALNAVMNNHGITLCVKYLCQQFLDSKQLVIPLNLPHPNKVKRYFVYSKQAANMTRLNLFMDWLKAEMG